MLQNEQQMHWTEIKEHSIFQQAEENKAFCLKNCMNDDFHLIFKNYASSFWMSDFSEK